MSEAETPKVLETHPNLKTLWLHRRSIAYMSVAGLFINQLLIFFGVIDIATVALAQTISWVYCFNIVGYIANNAFENIARMKFSKP